jgi:hypothetical protein
MFPGRCIVQNQKEYDQFIAGLKDRQKVAVQKFHPKGDTMLDSTHQYWCIYEGEWMGDRVLYDNDSHPIRPDGFLHYWNSDDPTGEVFYDRIVPWHDEFTPRVPKTKYRMLSDGYVRSERPVWESLWDCQYFFLDKYGKDVGSVSRSIREHEKRSEFRTHQYRVLDGDIIQVFGSNWLEFNDVPGYLYSERLPQ